jgi:hypothetical protein
MSFVKIDFWTQKMEINSFTTKTPHFLLLHSNVYYIYITWFKTLHKTSFFIFDILLMFCPNDKI